MGVGAWEEHPYSWRTGTGGVDYRDSEGMARDSGLGAVRVVEGGGGAGPLWRARRCFAAALLDGHAGEAHWERC